MRTRITQLVRSALRRSWSYLVTSLRRREELSALEDDPVGEFLDRKKRGIELLEHQAEKLTETLAASDRPKTPEASGQSEPVGEDKAKDKEVEIRTEEAEVQLQPAPETVPVTSGSAESVQADKEKKGVVLGENNEESEAKAKAITKEEFQAAEASAQSEVVEGKPVEKKSSQENENVESLLDVFRSEESDSGTLGALSKDLMNMSIYSLLEESKQVAAKMRSKKKEGEAPPES